MRKKTTTDEFINMSKEVEMHNGRNYIYLKTKYVNSNTPVTITCPIHGDFTQLPYVHLRGHGCPECAKERIRKKKRSCTRDFIEKSKKVIAHKGKGYIYSETNYKGSNTKVCVVCPKHGRFYVTPNNHLKGRGCPKCGRERSAASNLSSTDEFIEKARQKHNGKYDYSNVKYVNNHTKICIVCPRHGEFWQFPYIHLQRHGCPECAKERRSEKLSSHNECFVLKAQSIHKAEKYDYSNVNYINARTPVSIICPVHGVFRQIPRDHLQGHGCPKCNRSNLERKTEMFLSQHKIRYECQKKFGWMISDKHGKMSLDFYLPDYNAAIECQGVQHYKAHGIYTQEIVDGIKYRDELKRKLCQKYKVAIFYIGYNDNIKEKLNEIIRKFNSFNTA